MKTFAVILVVSLLLAGCVAPQQRAPKTPAVITTETPVCEGKRQCEAMWIDAQAGISLATGMKIRLLTDSRIETFPPRTYGYTGAVVTKYPIGDDKYEMRISISCYGHTDCSDERATGTNLFNLHTKAIRPAK